MSQSDPALGLVVCCEHGPGSSFSCWFLSGLRSYEEMRERVSVTRLRHGWRGHDVSVIASVSRWFILSQLSINPCLYFRYVSDNVHPGTLMWCGQLWRICPVLVTNDGQGLKLLRMRVRAPCRGWECELRVPGAWCGQVWQPGHWSPESPNCLRALTWTRGCSLVSPPVSGAGPLSRLAFLSSVSEWMASWRHQRWLGPGSRCRCHQETLPAVNNFNQIHYPDKSMINCPFYIFSRIRKGIPNNDQSEKQRWFTPERGDRCHDAPAPCRGWECESPGPGPWLTNFCCRSEWSQQVQKQFWSFITFHRWHNDHEGRGAGHPGHSVSSVRSLRCPPEKDKRHREGRFTTPALDTTRPAETGRDWPHKNSVYANPSPSFQLFRRANELKWNYLRCHN